MNVDVNGEGDTEDDGIDDKGEEDGEEDDGEDADDEDVNDDNNGDNEGLLSQQLPSASFSITLVKVKLISKIPSALILWKNMINRKTFDIN